MKLSIISFLTNIALNRQLSLLVPEEYDQFFSGSLEMPVDDPCGLEIEELDNLISDLELLNNNLPYKENDTTN